MSGKIFHTVVKGRETLVRKDDDLNYYGCSMSSPHMERFVRDHKEKFGLNRVLGYGVYAQVYSKKDNKRTAVKIGYLDKDDFGSYAYLNYIKIVSKMSDNPFFPKVNSVTVFKQRGHGDVCYVVELERLRRNTTVSNYVLEDDIIWLTNKDGRTLRREVRDAYRLCDIVVPESLKLHYVQMIKVLRHLAVRYGHDLDVHEENVMFRGKQLVVTDPVS